MCFSAGASFGVSALLVVGGIATLKQTNNSSQIPFACLPFLFGIQQFIEGFLWLSLTKPDYIDFYLPATYAFLFFAQVVWPIWVPFAYWRLEENKSRKKTLLYILILGCLVGMYLVYCLFAYPVGSEINGYHIKYDLDYQHNLIRYSGVFYFIPTVIPALISTKKYVFIFGVLILTSFLISKLYFDEYVISVWCYFAAALSIIIFFLIRSFAKKDEPEAETLVK